MMRMRRLENASMRCPNASPAQPQKTVTNTIRRKECALLFKSVGERMSARTHQCPVQLPGGGSKIGRTESESMGTRGGGCDGLKGFKRASESANVPFASANNSESTLFSASRSKVARQSLSCFNRKTWTRSATLACTMVSLSRPQVVNKTQQNTPVMIRLPDILTLDIKPIRISICKVNIGYSVGPFDSF